MRKFGLFSLLALLAAAPGCGSSSSGDGGIDGDIIDAGIDAEPQRGNVDNFDVCLDTPASPCDCNNDLECSDSNSECVPIAYFTGLKRCLPKCNATDDCPMNTFCYAGNGGNFGAQFAPMGDHCWFSLCGEFLDFLMVGVGHTGQACTLGLESGVPPGDQLPGFCIPIEDGDIGQCLEAGSVPPGGTCTWDFADRVRGGTNCDETGLCIGRMGQPGTCGQICDPVQVLTGGASDCTAVAGTQCQDSSSVSTLTDGHVRRATLGFCVTETACVAVGTNTCPPDGTTAQGCFVTNDIRPTGICSNEAQGSLGQGATGCSFNTTNNDAEECAAGLTCLNQAGGGTVCRALCIPPRHACASVTDCGPSMACTNNECVPPYTLPAGPDCATVATGFTCQNIFVGNGFDGTGGTADDNFSYEWGACLAP